MAIKNNDDVAHLLQAVDAPATPYREFDGNADHMSAPLIDAVFGSSPPDSAEDSPAPIGATRDVDLMADVFGGPAQASPRPVLPREDTPQPASAPLAMAPTVPRRSLEDIRRIIVRPAEETISSSPTEGLNGLFDRLAS
jgi:hypothetical protein